MKKIFTTFITLFCFSYLQAQTDSIATVPDTSLVKGFYKTYQEYLSNNPSVRLDFEVVPFSISKNDPTIIGAEYKIADSSDNFGDVWGFCDGKNIFVANGTFFVMKYWKLQCSGPNPFFYYKHKNIYFFPSVAGILGTALSTALPPFCDPMIIDNNGRPQDLSRFNVKKLFRDDPALLEEYKKEISHSPDVIIKYLIRYNDSRKPR